MNTFSTTFQQVKRKQQLSYKSLHNLKRKIRRQIRIEELTDEESDTELPESIEKAYCASVAGSQVNNLPDWDLSSVSSSENEAEWDESSLSSGVCDFDINKETPLHTECNLSLQKSLVAVSAVSTKHALSKSATSDILRLVKLHIPHQIPYVTSANYLQRAIGFDTSWTRRLFYCLDCMVKLEGLTYSCSKCAVVYEEKRLVEVGQFFVVLDLGKQFKLCLDNSDVKHALSAFLTDPFPLGHVQTGQKFSRINKSSTDLTCTFNTDGIPVFKSSNFAIWPVLFTINELPYYLRKRFVILAGLWFGVKKPDISLFLDPIIQEMNHLGVKPLHWTTNEGVRIKSRVYFVLCAVDSVARCMIQGHMQFNGKFGCNWCLNPGKTIKKGKGHCRVYPSSIDSGNLRSGAIYKTRACLGQFVSGQKFKSPLVDLLEFDIVSGFSVDYMHCILLGIVRSFTNIWLGDKALFFLDTGSVNEIDRILLNTKVPTEIVRTTRIIETIKHWKASEWRTWLFILPVVLKGVLKRKYLKHFGSLTRAIFLLLKEKVELSEFEESEELIKQFLKGGLKLYGEQFYSFNVHQLEHVTQTVKNWGPLWNSSAFQFESFNGKLLKFVKSSNGVAAQISEKFQAEMQIKQLLLACPEKKFEFLNPTPKHMRHNGKRFELLHAKPFVPDKVISKLVQHVCQPMSYFQSKTCIANFHMFKAKWTKKRCDNIVCLDEDRLAVIKKFLQVKVVNEEAYKYFVLVNPIPIKHWKNQCQILYGTENNELELELIELESLLLNKYFVICKNDNMYFVPLPNLFELD